MLKRLTRKLITLSVLVAALTAFSAIPAPAENFGCFCVREVDQATGTCVLRCCCGFDCTEYSC
jgi:hypothetical protein